MNGQGDLVKEYSRGLKGSRKSAEKIEAHHKGVSRPAKPFILAKNGEGAEVHGHTAHLEGKFPPIEGVSVIYEKYKEMLEYLAEYQYTRKGKNKYFILFVVEAAQEPPK